MNFHGQTFSDPQRVYAAKTAMEWELATRHLALAESGPLATQKPEAVSDRYVRDQKKIWVVASAGTTIGALEVMR